MLPRLPPSQGTPRMVARNLQGKQIKQFLSVYTLQNGGGIELIGVWGVTSVFDAHGGTLAPQHTVRFLPMVPVGVSFQVWLQ